MGNKLILRGIYLSVALLSLCTLQGCSDSSDNNTSTVVSTPVEDLIWEIPGTFIFNFEDGELGKSSFYYPEEYKWNDIWWQFKTLEEKQLTPINGSEMAVLGNVDYHALTETDLLSFTLSSEPILYGTDFVLGDVFVIHTGAGNYYKFQVVEYDGPVKKGDFTTNIYIRYKFFTDNEQLLH